MAAEQFGYTTAGLFGYSHLTGGYAGGQAEYVRVPMADVAPMKVPDGMSDDEVLFLTDIFPTGYQGAENAGSQARRHHRDLGCRALSAYFAIQSAKDDGCRAHHRRLRPCPSVSPWRRRPARPTSSISPMKTCTSASRRSARGKGADSVIDCVGMEASAGHGGIMGALGAIQEKLTSTERPYVLEEAIKAVRPCGIVSVPGVYGGPVPIDMGSVVQKGLTIKSGQTHVKRYLEPLTKLIQDGTIDTSSMITHRSSDLADGPDLYKTFKEKKDGCVKVVFNLA